MAKQAHFNNNKLVFNKDSEISESSGVYKFFNSHNEILYIGKAKNVKKRVRSYFNKVHDYGKTNVLVKKISTIKHIVVDSETDALVAPD